MSPIGTPDHIQGVDSNIIGYVDKYVDTNLSMAADATGYAIDVTGQGCFGLAAFVGDLPKGFLVVWIDGVKIFSQSPYNCRDFWGLVSPTMGSFFGCSKYDVETTEYSFWVNSNYNWVFYKTLKVGVWNNEASTLTVSSFYGWWKERP